MADISDGTYRISIYGQQFLTAQDGRVVLLPGEDRGQLWQIRCTDKGIYTIRQDNAGGYVSYEGEPDPYEPVRLLPDQRQWKITDGPEEGTVTIAAPGDDEPLTLGLSPILIFPPWVALSPPRRQDRPWTLQPA